MKTIILAYSLFFSILTYAQPTGEEKMTGVEISFFDQCQNKVFFNKKGISYKDKNNKKSIVSFFLKRYEVDIDNKKSTPGEEIKIDTDYIDNKLTSLFYPYYQRIGWENAVRYEELIIEWVIKKKLMKIIIKPSYYKDDIDLLNLPHINISFKEGVFEITDLGKPTCCD